MDVTIYLDIDGVLITKFSNGTQFDPICVAVLQDLFAHCQTKFNSVQLCLISNWRFDKTAKELTELFTAAHLLENIDEFIISTEYSNRAQQILALQQNEHFIILDDATYTDLQLQKHLIQLHPEDGLRAIDDITLLITKFKGR